MKKRICFFGAGAVGCTLAAKFHDIADVSLIARGEHLRTLQRDGLTYIGNRDTRHYNFHCTDDPTELPSQDIIFLTVKAYSLHEIAPKIATIMHEDTVIIPICNGIPWWLTRSLPDIFGDFSINCLDPDGILRKHIPANTLLGGVTYMGASLTKAGEVQNKFNPRLLVGEMDGTASDRATICSEICLDAGFKDPVSTNIRGEILTKLCWNITFNTLSVIYNMTSSALVEHHETKQLAIKAIGEMEHLANTLDIALSLSIEDHLNIALKVGNHKPSMLQDYEAGKTLETCAIIDSVIEICTYLNLKTPTLRHIAEQLHSK